MKNKDGNLQRAIPKLSRHDHVRWVGYLTPSEILALVDAGARVDAPDQYKVGWARDDAAKGLSTCRTFYFHAPRGSTLEQRLINRHGHDVRHG